MVWIRDLVSFVLCSIRLSNLPKHHSLILFLLFPTDLQSYLHHNKYHAYQIFMEFLGSLFCSVAELSIPVPKTHCFHFHSFIIISLAIWRACFITSFFFTSTLASPIPLLFYIHFRICLWNSKQAKKNPKIIGVFFLIALNLWISVGQWGDLTSLCISFLSLNIGCFSIYFGLF